MGASKAPINEAVNFLDKFNPAALAELRETLPSSMAGLLERGGVAGEVDASTHLFARVQIASLEEVIRWCDEAGVVARTRLQQAKRLNLAAGIVAIVGSSSVLATVAAQSMVLTIASGLVAFTGSVLSYVADQKTRAEQGRTRILIDIYSELSKNKLRAVQIRDALRIYIEVGIDSDREPIVVKLIGEANALALLIRR